MVERRCLNWYVRVVGGQLLEVMYRRWVAHWHPEHFVCAGCHRPLNTGSFVLHQNAPYHAECYGRFVAPHCAYCGRALIGEYAMDHWGTPYCKAHERDYPRCAYCGRLVSPQQQEQGAETVRCPICRQHAVETIEDARPLYAHVVQWAGNQGIKYNNLPLRLELCDRTRVAQLLHGRSGGHPLGVTTSTTSTQNGRVVSTQVTGVAILAGLPPTLFQGVTMHELGHVWLIAHGVQGLPEWAEEGFCELLAYRFYQSLQTPEGGYHALSLEQNPSPIYGEGFRRVLALSEKYGFARILTTLDTTKRLPL